MNETATQHRDAPLVEMRNINVSFGGIRAVDDVSVELRPGISRPSIKRSRLLTTSTPQATSSSAAHC